MTHLKVDSTCTREISFSHANLQLNVLENLERKNILIYIQQDAKLHSLFYLENCSTCFGWYLHPSSGAQTTLCTAAGICHTVTATCRYSTAHILRNIACSITKGNGACSKKKHTSENANVEIQWSQRRN